MILSTFGKILQQAVLETPGAVGGILAAGDGEQVDSFSIWSEDDWFFLTAHFGILVQHMRSALHTFHFGDVEFMFLSFQGLEVIIQVVYEEYFALLAVEPPMQLGAATQSLQDAAARLREEMN